MPASDSAAGSAPLNAHPRTRRQGSPWGTIETMTHQRARRDDPDPPLDSLVLRGLPLTERELRENAVANFEYYGFYGISVFHADDHAHLTSVCAAKLSAFKDVALFVVGDLRASGLALWATGMAPHYDVVRGEGDQSPDDLVRRLLRTPWTRHVNASFQEGGD